MPARQKRWVAIGAPALLLAVLGVSWPFVTASAALLDLAGQAGLARRLLPVTTHDVRTHRLLVQTRAGEIEARVYAPRVDAPATIVVFPGVHGAGADEPRLTTFSRRLASTGRRVVTVPLPELRSYRISSASTDTIEDAIRWIASRRDLAPRGRVAVVGVSFSGGLALTAAGRPGIAPLTSLVLSLGGHGDLERVLRYLCTGRLPDGTYRRPHEYGLAVAALAAAPRLAPTDQTAALESALVRYLDASLDDTPERAFARPMLENLARSVRQLPNPSRRLLQALLDGDLASLGRAILPYAETLAADPALSPERSPLTTAPVFLVHGLEDNVVPSSETPSLAAHFRAAGRDPAGTLLTPVLSHLGLEGQAGLTDLWALVRTWQHVRAAEER